MKNLSPAVILVIDANALTLTATSAVLNCQNYEVLCAQNVAAAVDVCQQNNLDLIVCDVSLSRENDGYDLIQALRQLPSIAEVPVVYVSAGQMTDVVRKSTIAGSAYHLKKPFEPSALFELIENALWLPHLVNSHISAPHPKKSLTPKPHIPIPGTNSNSVNTTLNTHSTS